MMCDTTCQCRKVREALKDDGYETACPRSNPSRRLWIRRRGTIKPHMRVHRSRGGERFCAICQTLLSKHCSASVHTNKPRRCLNWPEKFASAYLITTVLSELLASNFQYILLKESYGYPYKIRCAALRPESPKHQVSGQNASKQKFPRNRLF